MLAIIVFGVIVFVSLVYLALQSKKHAFVALTLLFIGLAFIFYIHNNIYRQSTENIQPSQVSIRNIELIPYLNNYNFTASITNNHLNAQITRIHFQFILLDCKAPEQCQQLADARKIIYVNLPPGKTRAVHSSVSFSLAPSEVPSEMQPDWQYNIEKIYSKPWRPPITYSYDRG